MYVSFLQKKCTAPVPRLASHSRLRLPSMPRLSLATPSFENTSSRMFSNMSPFAANPSVSVRCVRLDWCLFCRIVTVCNSRPQVQLKLQRVTMRPSRVSTKSCMQTSMILFRLRSLGTFRCVAHSNSTRISSIISRSTCTENVHFGKRTAFA